MNLDEILWELYDWARSDKSLWDKNAIDQAKKQIQELMLREKEIREILDEETICNCVISAYKNTGCWSGLSFLLDKYAKAISQKMKERME